MGLGPRQGMGPRTMTGPVAADLITLVAIAQLVPDLGVLLAQIGAHTVLLVGLGVALAAVGLVVAHPVTSRVLAILGVGSGLLNLTHEHGAGAALVVLVIAVLLRWIYGLARRVWS